MLKKLAVGIAAACVLSAPVSAKHFEKEFTYRVTVTNLTNRTFISKVAVATHERKFKAFELGVPNFAFGLEVLAETGFPDTLVDELDRRDDVKQALQLSSGVNNTPATMVSGDASAPNGGLKAGESFSIDIQGDYKNSSVSVFGMIAPSNDAFIAANSIPVPRHGKPVVIFSPVYDAGTEANTEFCYAENDDATTGGGLTLESEEFPYVVPAGLPSDLFIHPVALNENNPDLIPVPTNLANDATNPRHVVCRLTDHTKHTFDTGRLATLDLRSKRIPPSGNPPAQLGQGGEGRVNIHRGIQGVGQLNPSMFDWRNPGAKITIRRIR